MTTEVIGHYTTIGDDNREHHIEVVIEEPPKEEQVRLFMDNLRENGSGIPKLFQVLHREVEIGVDPLPPSAS